MRKYFILIYIILLSSTVFSQHPGKSYLDSLYYTFLASRGMLSEYHGSRSFSIDTSLVKCGFGIVNDTRLNLNYFTPEQQKILLGILQRPNSDTSFVTPNKFFRVHYFKTGPDAPGYSLTELAIALDSAYNFEVNYLGYPPPPGDSIINTSPSEYGGDNLYDIYIKNLNPYSEGYGYTQPETEIPNAGSGRYTTFIVIDNDFGQGYYTHGIDAARVTVAHEFHHSIQIGDYYDRYDQDGFFYEMTSTSMEHFVYPSIHDFYDYMPDYFNHPDRSFANNNGYDLAIWNIYLQEKFGQYSPMEGFNIIKRQWQLIPQMRAIRAINNSLTEQNSSFGKELNTFGIWTYLTGYRTHPGQYFKEAVNYPLITTLPEINYSPPSKSVSLNVNPLSNNFIEFYNTAQNDTLIAIITNANVNAGVDSLSNFYPVTYKLYSSAVNGATKISDNYYEQLVADNPNQYFDSEILNNIVVKQDTTIYKTGSNTIDYAFPNPFKYWEYYQNGQYISFPVKIPLSQNADVNIYSINMDLIFSGSLQVTSPWSKDYNLIRWNVKDLKNRKLATGVYVYIIKYGDQTFKGKFVVFQ